MSTMAEDSGDLSGTETCLPDEAALEAFLDEHPHEAAEVAFLRAVLQPGMTVMDVGAGVGVTAMAIARRVGKGGRVYAFEPLPRHHAMLQRNLSLNMLGNVTPLQAALTDSAGRIDFYDKDLSSGIVFESGAPRIVVDSMTIDEFLEERGLRGPDVISMDCEGSELLALRGAQHSLRANGLTVFCEIHNAFLQQLGHSVGDIVDYLRDIGYEVRGIRANGLQMEECPDSPEYLHAYIRQEGAAHISNGGHEWTSS